MLGCPLSIVVPVGLLVLVAALCAGWIG